jgi:hypothetical protein
VIWLLGTGDESRNGQAPVIGEVGWETSAEASKRHWSLEIADCFPWSRIPRHWGTSCDWIL